MNIYLIAILILAIINILLSAKISLSILHPTRLFTLFWTAFVVLPVTLWKVDYVWDYKGLVWMELAVFFTVLGGRVSKNFGLVWNRNSVQKLSSSFDRNEESYSWWALLGVIVIGVVSAFLSLRENGFGIGDILSIRGIINVSSTSAVLRYTENRSTSTLHQLLSILIYAGPLCGGFTFNFSKKFKYRILSIATMIPIVMEMVFTSGKSGFIASIFLWLAGWCISYELVNKRSPIVKTKSMILLGLGVGCLLLILFLVMLLRTGEFSGEMIGIIYQKFWVYAFGHMIEFDAWFSMPRSLDYGLGSNTYMTFFRLLGLVSRKGGIYDVIIPEYGNVFTAFRGVIEDFGTVGGLLYCMLRGVVTQLSVNSLSKGKFYSFIPIMLVACSFFWNLYGFIVSPWVYTSYIMAICIFGLFSLVFCKKFKR